MKKIGMNKKWILPGVIIFIVFVLILWFVGTYNGLIRSKAEVDESWANVETQYQRRADLVPNLVETVKGSASFQQETFAEVTKLRTQWQSAKAAGNRAAQIQAGESLGAALKSLLLVVENYPDLDVEAFKNLQAQLEGTENRIAVARTRYNERVKVYNVRIKRIPTVIIANMFGYTAEPFFEAEEGAEEVPRVSFE